MRNGVSFFWCQGGKVTSDPHAILRNPDRVFVTLVGGLSGAPHESRAVLAKPRQPILPFRLHFRFCTLKEQAEVLCTVQRLNRLRRVFSVSLLDLPFQFN